MRLAVSQPDPAAPGAGGRAAKTRLGPRGPLVVTHAFCLLLIFMFGGIAYVETDLVRLSFEGLLLSALLLWAAFLRVTLVRRRREPPVPRADGSIVVESPVVLIALLVGAWVSMLAVFLFWVSVMLTAPLSARGVFTVLVYGVVGLASLPDFVRMLTGRLHRWRVVADDTGVQYRGYRTDRAFTWGQVSAIRRSERPLGIALEPMDGSSAVVLPTLAFDVAPDVLLVALEKRRTRLKQR